MKVHVRSMSLESSKVPLLLLVGVLSCSSSESNDPTNASVPPAGELAPSEPSPIDGDPSSALPAAPVPGASRRLTALQYRHTVDDLFGAGLTYAELEGEPAVNGFTTVGGSVVSTSRNGVEQFESAAATLAAQIMADEARRAKVISCSPVPAAFDEACATTSVTQLGRRVFRRPLEQAETDRYVTLWRTLSDLSTFSFGAEGVVSAMLQSPKFLYRVEYGQPQAGESARRYTGYELASRLSYLLWNTTPDDDLLDAADRGDLDTDEGVAARAEAMLDSPRSRAGLRDFFAEFMYLKDFGVNAAASRTLSPELATAMREQALRDAEEIVFDSDTRFSELLDGTQTHLNGELAAHYGIPGPTGADFERVTLPDGERVGLLGTGAFLVRQGNGEETSPVRRGKVILESFLCTTVPSPPAGVVPVIPEFDPNVPRTTRERLETHRNHAQCLGCHVAMDPLGLALENFDATAKFRTTDNGLPIDTSGEFDGQSFEGLRELATLLADSPRVAACTVTRFFRYASGAPESVADAQRLASLQSTFSEGGGRLRPTILAYLRSSLFTQASDPL